MLCELLSEFRCSFLSSFVLEEGGRWTVTSTVRGREPAAMSFDDADDDEDAKEHEGDGKTIEGRCGWCFPSALTVTFVWSGGLDDDVVEDEEEEEEDAGEEEEEEKDPARTLVYDTAEEAGIESTRTIEGRGRSSASAAVAEVGPAVVEKWLLILAERLLSVSLAVATSLVKEGFRSKGGGFAGMMMTWRREGVR